MTAPVSCMKKPGETAIVKMPNVTRNAQIISSTKFVIAHPSTKTHARSRPKSKSGHCDFEIRPLRVEPKGTDWQRGNFRDATVLRKFGDVPDDLSAL
jgi:hypothetical protein